MPIRSKQEEAMCTQKFEDLWNRLVECIVHGEPVDRAFCIEQFRRVAALCRRREGQSPDMGQKFRYGASADWCERYACPTFVTVQYLRTAAEESWERAKSTYGQGYLWTVGQVRLCLIVANLSLEDILLEESAIAAHYREDVPGELEGVV